jgi:predicted RNase H-like HicB family nuclease
MPDYVALIHKEPDSDYGVSFPDFPGAITAGTTLDDARAMAEEALSFHIQGMIEDGDPVPEPSTLEAVMADKTNRDAVACLVSVRRPAVRTVRVNVTMGEEALATIDQYAETHGYTRSGFMVRAALEQIHGALPLIEEDQEA